MAQVQIKLAPNGVFFYGNTKQTALENLGRYTALPVMTTWMAGEAAAEELFDLTNNPSRQDERERCYGRGRSLSVGDIVNVDGVDYLCASFGWEVV